MGFRLQHIATLIVLLSLSCSKVKDGCTEKGQLTEFTRQVGWFSEIQAGDRLNVQLIQDPARHGEIVLKGPANLLDGVSLEIQSGRLILGDDNRCKWLRSLEDRVLCQVYFDSISEIHSFDDARFFSTDTIRMADLLFIHKSTASQELVFDIGTLSLEHREAGQVSLVGNSDIIVAHMFETGKLDAGEMPVDVAFIYHHGLNHVWVSPRYLLECLIENSGNVYYNQQPVNGVKVTGRGSGTVQRIF